MKSYKNLGPRARSYFDKRIKEQITIGTYSDYTSTPTTVTLVRPTDFVVATLARLKVIK